MFSMKAVRVGGARLLPLFVMFGVSSGAAMAAGTLRIGMSAGDIPRIMGQPDQGYAGNLFAGMTMYDSLTQWDLSSEDKASNIIAGLATSWAIDPADNTKWRLTLRKGVKFHDGSAFNADAVVWNVEKVLKPDALHYDAGQAALTVHRIPSLLSARKIDDFTVELKTSEPDSSLPINLTNLFIASPAHWKALFAGVKDGDDKARAKAAWAAFEKQPSGSGPWKFKRLVPRQELELSKNPEYWDVARRPKVDQLSIRPISDTNARAAALMSGKVDWIEAPAPDALAQLKAAGFKVLANEQPHAWVWHFSYQEGSPWKDARVRQAANLCIDRVGIRDALLKGLMVPATGWWEPGHPWAGKPKFSIKYDANRARALMEEAGYGNGKRAKVKVLTSASGSGQMQPVIMNEYLQAALSECHFDVTLQTNDWNTVLESLRSGAQAPISQGANALNVAFPSMDPMMIYKLVGSKFAPPKGANWGGVHDAKIDELIQTARRTFEPAALDTAIGKLHEVIVDDALFLFVAHDVGARAISAKVRGVVQAKNWFVNFSSVELK